jgi:hypothetical protein
MSTLRIAREKRVYNGPTAEEMATMSPLKLSEIADRIDAHLKRFEASGAINKSVRRNRVDTRPYCDACAYSIGRYVFVRYVSYQGATSMKRDEAEKYLAWLDSGNVGKHYDC